MTKYTNIQNKNVNTEDKKDKWKRRIMMIVIIILIILSLITSCSCTSNFFGKIGDIFKTESNYPIDGSDEPEVITNKYLKFDTDELEIALSDAKAKLSFSYENINPKDFTCSTSDASTATCYVENGYVVINPKKEGTVKITLKTETNGKVYEATATVTITETEKYIKLSSNSGTINLAYAKEKNIYYTLVGLKGEVTVKSSDDSIATATVKDGTLKITAHKKGTAQITVSINYNGQDYSVTYKLNVINDKSVKPNDTANDNQNKLDSNSKLKQLSMSWTDFHFNPDTLEYSVGVRWRDKVTIKATPQSSKAKVTYTFNGQTASDLKNLKLNLGDNIVLITVTAEDGSKTVYKVVLNKVKSSDNYLDKITTSAGNLTPKFDKNQLLYTIDVDNDMKTITLDAIPKDKESTVAYTFNGETVPSLNGLNLNEGPNSIVITITAEDGTERTYRIIVNRASDDAELSGNSLLKSLTGLDFSFDPYIENYIIGVSYENNPITLTAVPSDEKAGVVYKLNGSVVSSLDNLDLNPGDNTITIEVTSPNGQSKTTYNVMVNRGLSDRSTDLLNLAVIKSTFPLNPPFDVNKLDYKVYVNPDTTNISFEVTTNINAEKVTYRYNGAIVNDLFDLVVNRPVSVATVTVEGTLNLETVAAASDAPRTMLLSTRNLASRATARVSRTYTITVIRPEETMGDPSLKSFTVDGQNILGPNKITVDKNSVTLVATPVENDATVEFLYDGTSHKGNTFTINDLKSTNNVQVVITTKDGQTRAYTFTIDNKSADPVEEEAYLEEFIINNQDMLHFDGNITVEEGENVRISAKANEGSTITYYYGSNAATNPPISAQELMNKLNNDLKPGETTTIMLKVKSANGTAESTYYATITRKSNEPQPPVVTIDSYIENITIGSHSEFKFNKNIPTYTVTAQSDEASIDLQVTKIPNTIVTYTYTDENGKTVTAQPDLIDNIRLNLKVGSNILKINVVSTEDATKTNEYTITINRLPAPIYDLAFTNGEYTCTIENGECKLTYIITKDGTPIEDTSFYDSASVIPTVDNPNITVKKDKNEIIVNWDQSKITVDDKPTVTISMDGQVSTAKLVFESKDHYITPLKDIYDYNINFVENGKPSDNQKDIILNTDIFIGKTTVTGNSKEIKVCTGVNCVTITASEGIKIDLINKTEEGPTSLALQVTADGTTENATIKVSGTAYGKDIAMPKDITIAIFKTKKINLTLHANGGTFFEVTDENDSEDATTVRIPVLAGKDYDILESEPFKLKDNCNTYKFIGYSKESNLTNPDEDTLIKTTIPGDMLTSDLDLYAYYSAEATPRTDEILTVGFAEEDIFINEDFKDKNIDKKSKKIIYPGARGEHLMNIKNTSDLPIEILGITLKEKDTVCIGEDRCLNMGYYLVPKDTEVSPVPELKNGKYKLLHSLENGTVEDNSYDRLSDTIGKTFKLKKGDNGIIIQPGETAYVTLYWNWVDFNDKENNEIDTIIGNRAAELGDQDLIYSLGVGFHYRLILNDCIPDKTE